MGERIRRASLSCGLVKRRKDAAEQADDRDAMAPVLAQGI